MRGRIVFFSVACVGSAACTSLLGDFEVGASRASDAGLLPSDAGIPKDAGASADATAQAAAPDVSAVVSDISIFLGQGATLDGSKSTTTRGMLTFQWRFGVGGTPPGSRLTNADLSGASSATVTFVPDVVGVYGVQLIVRALGVTASQMAKVTVAVPQVFFAQGGGAAGGNNQNSALYAIADLDGGNARPVLCPNPMTNGSNQVSLAPFAAYAGRAYDYWEGPAGQPSRFAAFTVDFNPDAGFSTHLWSGTTSSTCGLGTSPTDLGSAGFGIRPYGSQPHFNADGTRFVVFDRQWRILTYGADAGSADQPNVIATYPVPYAQAPAFLDPVGLEPSTGYVFEPPRVTWTATGLAWAQPTADGWEVVTAADKPNQTPTTYMTCPGITPREIAMLPDGTVIASYRLTPLASENLYRLKPDAQQTCSHEVQYTDLSDAGGSTATDFAISPDGKQIAFAQIDTGLQNASPWLQGGSQWPGGYVYVVPVAGGPPTQVSSEPALYGPRWIGGGTALVFTRLDFFAPLTGKPATSIIVVAPDGGAEQVIAQGDGVYSFVSTSGNAACSIGKTREGGAGGMGAAGIAALVTMSFLVRRRRHAFSASTPKKSA
jgi:hypothetical protein